MKATGRPFYNTSHYSFANLLADADGLADNLADYIDRFSPDVDVFEYFDFKKEILALEQAEFLRGVVTSFKAVDLHPHVVSNADQLLALCEELGLVPERESVHPYLTGREFVLLNAKLQDVADADAAVRGQP